MLRPLVLLLVLVPLCTGCVAVAAAGVMGLGLVQYQRNELSQDYSIDLESAWQATLEGFRQLSIVPGPSALSSTEGVLESGDVHVVVERHVGGFTRVRVRVGTFRSDDNVRRAEILLHEIGSAIAARDELRAWAENGPARKAPRPE